MISAEEFDALSSLRGNFSKRELGEGFGLTYALVTSEYYLDPFQTFFPLCSDSLGSFPSWLHTSFSREPLTADSSPFVIMFQNQ
jgi:hypothetical protein